MSARQGWTRFESSDGQSWRGQFQAKGDTWEFHFEDKSKEGEFRYTYALRTHRQDESTQYHCERDSKSIKPGDFVVVETTNGLTEKARRVTRGTASKPHRPYPCGLPRLQYQVDYGILHWDDDHGEQATPPGSFYQSTNFASAGPPPPMWIAAPFLPENAASFASVIDAQIAANNAELASCPTSAPPSAVYHTNSHQDFPPMHPSFGRPGSSQQAQHTTADESQYDPPRTISAGLPAHSGGPSRSHPH